MLLAQPSCAAANKAEGRFSATFFEDGPKFRLSRARDSKSHRRERGASSAELQAAWSVQKVCFKGRGGKKREDYHHVLTIKRAASQAPNPNLLLMELKDKGTD